MFLCIFSASKQSVKYISHFLKLELRLKCVRKQIRATKVARRAHAARFCEVLVGCRTIYLYLSDHADTTIIEELTLMLRLMSLTLELS